VLRQATLALHIVIVRQMAAGITTEVNTGTRYRLLRSMMGIVADTPESSVMTQSSATDPAAPSVREDHTQVTALMNSPDMQKRLEDARVRRAKILEARDSEVAKPTDLNESGVGLGVRSLVSPAGSDEPSLPLPAVTAQEQPVRETVHGQSQAYSLVIGLLAGLALGSGIMWYSGVIFPGISTTPDVAGTLVAEEDLASAADGNEVATIATKPIGIDPAPPTQASVAESGDQPLERPLADQSPVKPAFDAFQAPQASRPDRASQEQIPTIAAESPPVLQQKTTPVLGSAQANDQPPSMSIQPVAPRQTARLIGAVPDPATAPDNAPLQVALHISPDLSQAELDDAYATVTTAGVELASSSIASFGVPQSEVRYFHKSDALSAKRMAQELRINVRDYSAYRPAPVAGTLEIWFAEGS